MSEWWEKPYQGGPAVKVSGFPRPLYPPDAKSHGKTPSEPGSDVNAYKRTISRAGRWPWQTFDNAFSNAFSHGKAGGNVGDSGVAGVQRQMHVDATGWINSSFFNTLRCIVIPEPLDHAGEMAMDAYAVELINQAFAKYGGHEPAPTTMTIRRQALTRAVSQLGVTESPPGSNQQQYGAWYGMNGVPWCAIFVSWSFVHGADDLGKVSSTFKAGSYYSYVPYIVEDARAKSHGLQTVTDPIPGDLVCYDWNWDNVWDHVGIFEKWADSSSWLAIEGNTSTENDSNGGQVMRRQRYKNGQGTVFVRVAEP